MQIISERTYNVMDGEPHLGKQIETVVGVDRDEYIEAIVEAIENGATETSDTFEISDNDVGVQEYHLGCDFTQDELDSIYMEMDINFLNDDYGSEKVTNFLYEVIDSFIPDDWSDEFEITRMRGY